MLSIKYLIKNIPFEIERAVITTLYKKFKLRPSSKPFLSGDTYRALADNIYDETKKCGAFEIKKNNIVFVSSYLLDKFVKEVLDKIQEKFILITHQGDTNIENTDKYRIIADNEKIIHWFCQNCLLEHEKVTPLPIGLEDRWRHNAGAIRDFKNKKLTEKTKENKILLGFSLNTNPDSRFKCYRALWHDKKTTEIYIQSNSHLYRKLLAKHMFVASPAGNGLDCHRTWEAMYFKVIPIVEDNYMYRYFKKLGLPLYIIEDWEALRRLSTDELRNIYNAIINNSTLEPLFLNYWIEQIEKYKEK